MICLDVEYTLVDERIGGEENEKSNSVSTANGVATSLWDSRLLFCRNVYLYVVFAL